MRQMYKTSAKKMIVYLSSLPTWKKQHLNPCSAAKKSAADLSITLFILNI